MTFPLSVSAGPAADISEVVSEDLVAQLAARAKKERFVAAISLGADATIQGTRHMLIDQTFSAKAVDDRLQLAG